MSMTSYCIISTMVNTSNLVLIGVNVNVNSGTFSSFDDSGDTMGDTCPCVDAADLGTSITGETSGEWLFGSGTAT